MAGSPAEWPCAIHRRSERNATTRDNYTRCNGGIVRSFGSGCVVHECARSAGNNDGRSVKTFISRQQSTPCLSRDDSDLIDRATGKIGGADVDRTRQRYAVAAVELPIYGLRQQPSNVDRPLRVQVRIDLGSWSELPGKAGQ